LSHCYAQTIQADDHGAAITTPPSNLALLNIAIGRG
jgi:hypothetical protein